MSTTQGDVAAMAAAKASDFPSIPGGDTTLAPLGSVNAFAQAVKMAQFLAPSALIPDAFRNQPANIVIAIDIAHRSGAGLFSVMQSLYIVHGKPGFSAAYLIATLNATKRFSALRFVYEGEGMDRSCYATATELKTGEKCQGVRVSMGMAKAEGWIDRKGSKWATMPDLMLQYRAATFFVRAYAPEVSLGLPTTDELDDVGPTAGAAPQQQDFGVRSKSGRGGKGGAAAAAGNVIEGEATVVGDKGAPDATGEASSATSEAQGASKTVQGATATVDGLKVDTSTGEVLGKAQDDGPTEAEREAIRRREVEEAAKEARHQAAQNGAGAAPAETRHEDKAPASGAAPAKAQAQPDGGQRPATDLTAGMTAMLERKLQEKGLVWTAAESAFGQPFNRSTINAAIAWLDSL